MQRITSTQNPKLRALRELKQGKARQAEGCFLVEGYKLVMEALRDAQVITVLVDENRLEDYAPVMAARADVLIAPEHIVGAVCDARTPQGIVAAVRFPAPFDLDTLRDGAVLVLDGVQDPGNVGTMLRTAEAAGFQAAMLSPTCADAFAPKTVRATMGSVFRMPIWRGALMEALKMLRRRDCQLVASVLGGEPFEQAKYLLRWPLALVIGSEGNGISDEVLSLADKRVALAMRGKAESLNAAVAAGILMYGIMEQHYAD